jgi:hypothetical protein
MSASPLGEFVKSTVSLVVTVTGNRRKVDVPVVGPIAIEVRVFEQVIRLEKESACLAAPFLFLQQRCQSPRHAWVLPHRRALRVLCRCFTFHAASFSIKGWLGQRPSSQARTAAS